ncbi:MAG: HAMP domain-containing protein [Magnetococcales bacterium]|nr:HAMP domain-containing protein [Magnetococcales bacterium]MBF0157298.1 HAMP domain-containing protein [Magnetococcales bacterium]
MTEWIRSRLFDSFRRSIGRRVLLVVGLLGSLSLASMSLLSIRSLEASLLLQSEAIHTKLAESVSQGLQAIMLAGYADVAHRYAEEIKKVEGLDSLIIMRTDGLEAFRDNKTIAEVNRRIGEEEFLPRPRESENRVLAADHEGLKSVVADPRIITLASEINPENGERSLTFLAPIRNTKECARCHGRTPSVRGVVLLTTSLALVDERILLARIQGATTLAVALLVFLGLLRALLKHAIDRPMTRIEAGIHTIAAGNLRSHLTITRHSPDEMDRIGLSVNQMAENLTTHIRAAMMSAANLFVTLRSALEIKVKLLTGSNHAQQIAGNVAALNRTLAGEVQSLRVALGEASVDVDGVAAAMGELAGNITTIAETSAVTSREVQRMATLADEAADRADRVNRGFDQVNASVSGMADAARELKSATGLVQTRSSRAMKAALATSHNAGQAEQVMESMRLAASRISEISKIIGHITQISQMVAINAAIEADKAGEQGRGFVAVAREVRELALKTDQAAQQVTRMIGDLQLQAGNASGAIADMTRAASQIEEANRDILQAVEFQNQAISRIETSSQGVFQETDRLRREASGILDAAGQTAAAAATVAGGNDTVARLTREAAAGGGRITANANRVRQVVLDLLEFAQKTESISGVVRDNMADSHRLTEEVLNLALSLDDIVDSLRGVADGIEAAHGNLEVGAPPFDLELFKGDDFKWAIRLQESFTSLEPELISPDPGKGSFPDWLETEGAAHRSHPGVVTALAARGHYLELVGQIQEKIRRKETAAGQALYPDLKAARDAYGVALDHLFGALWTARTPDRPVSKQSQ